MRTRRLGYLVTEMDDSDLFYGWYVGEPNAKRWETRNKVVPMSIGKARAALHRMIDQRKARGMEFDKLAIILVEEQMTVIEHGKRSSKQLLPFVQKPNDK